MSAVKRPAVRVRLGWLLTLLLLPLAAGRGPDEEEVVLDRYASLDEQVLRSRPKVNNRADDGLAEMLPPGETPERPELTLTGTPTEPAAAPKSAPAHDASDNYDVVMPEEQSAVVPQPNSPVQSSSPPAGPISAHAAAADDDMIIVEDEPAPGAAPATSVRRKDFGQLFAKLRQD